MHHGFDAWHQKTDFTDNEIDLYCDGITKGLIEVYEGSCPLAGSKMSVIQDYGAQHFIQ